MVSVDVLGSGAVRYLNLLPVQHGHLPHVPEGLQQIVVKLSGGLQKLPVGLVLVGVHLQQLHHAVHGFVSVQHLEPKQTLPSERSVSHGHSQVNIGR